MGPAEGGQGDDVYLLRHEALEVERWNRLNPDQPARVPYVSQVLPAEGGPVVIATDWLKAVPDLVARWLPRTLCEHSPKRRFRLPCYPVNCALACGPRR